jgi:phage-related baseplate assembly protein
MEINLITLPNLTVITKLSYAEYKQKIMERITPLLDASVVYETSDESVLSEALAYVLTHEEAKLNERFKALMPIYAKGNDLDVACMNNYGTVRLNNESDDAFLKRSIYSLQQSNTAGSEWSYYYHTYNVDAHIVSVKAFRSNAGEVTVAFYALFTQEELRALLNITNKALSTEEKTLIEVTRAELINTVKLAVKTRLNEDKIRPLNELQIIKNATIIPYTINATIRTKLNIDGEIAKNEALKRVESFVKTLTIGEEIKRSKLISLLHAEGVGEVLLNSPSSNIVVNNESVAVCTDVIITQEVETDE